MANTTTPQKISALVPSKAPNLPIAPVVYSQQYQDQLNNVLRLYFNQIDNFSQPLSGGIGGAFINFPYGEFLGTTTQTVATINTATKVLLNTVDLENNIALDTTNNRITFSYPGIYRVSYSSQISNGDNQNHDIDIWYRLNGVDVPNSATVQTVLSTHGGELGYGHIVGESSVKIAAGDYVELWWSTNSTQVTITQLPAITTPFPSPAAAAMDVIVTFVSSV